MFNQNTIQAQAELPRLRRAWLVSQGLTNTALAKRFGVSISRMSVIFRTGRCSKKYIEVLRNEYRMPESLLPEPTRERRGRISFSERRDN
ncbi:XRE family transcriptional regulator [Desulfobaculum bizertense]|uniref:XRE family transcriptional regulator n=1 Tax=Desulfobaculum bizertense TaxID=376490 RepID=UPI001F2AAE0A|nr:XRE family transcriptional regulator [Desulfobaculum bizertense]UIJ38561.1 XRE family transcriptional regulator [Desulfobaculum bizertense]